MTKCLGKGGVSAESKGEIAGIAANFTFHSTTVVVSLVMLALVVLSGCATRGSVQDNPSANQKVVFASAYSTEDCQAKMNDLAQNEVHMISDDQRLATSIFSLGIVPSHQCIGIAKDTAAVAPIPAKHE